MGGTYSPSTDEVREALRDEMFPNASDAAFDRWLESVRAEERERIAREAEKAWQGGSWALTRGTADWIRAQEGA